MASLEEKKKLATAVVPAPSSANLPTYLALAAAGLALGLSFIIFREIKKMRVTMIKLEKEKVPTDLTEKLNASDAYSKEVGQKLEAATSAMQRMQAQQQQIAQQYQILASEVAQQKFGEDKPMDQFRMGSGAAKVNGNNTEEVEIDSDSDEEEPKTKKSKKKTSG